MCQPRSPSTAIYMPKISLCVRSALLNPGEGGPGRLNPAPFVSEESSLRIKVQHREAASSIIQSDPLLFINPYPHESAPLSASRVRMTLPSWIILWRPAPSNPASLSSAEHKSAPLNRLAETEIVSSSPIDFIKAASVCPYSAQSNSYKARAVQSGPYAHPSSSVRMKSTSPTEEKLINVHSR
ncbi:hypothetical protein K432DRAFT_393443 [Lepidopterella palustris CBS 459.81]|uniref:Uncharacterized protein n=1 Tax=Lepidopterella palustris CBS 459.81 TaxID=1314670 RepID=A0A8E2JFD3_9PEZI|nr:hypothetical protein K432DRAFT_393443 [Lepidopterella palustris CBS 459.81]